MTFAHLGSGAAAVVLLAVTVSSAPPAGPVRFAPHDIDADFRGGYAVDVADFNKDGKPDVIANSLGVSEVAWYENPSWARHVIVADARQVVNQAMYDVDGDGIPEIAFQSGFAMVPGKSEGLNWLARHQGDPRQPWKVDRVDAFPTSHHVAWADFDGDGTRELVNAPLLGPKGLAPTYDQDKASIFWYSPKDWTRHADHRGHPWASSTACGSRSGTATTATRSSSPASRELRCTARPGPARR